MDRVKNLCKDVTMADVLEMARHNVRDAGGTEKVIDELKEASDHIHTLGCSMVDLLKPLEGVLHCLGGSLLLSFNVPNLAEVSLLFGSDTACVLNAERFLNMVRVGVPDEEE